MFAGTARPAARSLCCGCSGFRRGARVGRPFGFLSRLSGHIVEDLNIGLDFSAIAVMIAAHIQAEDIEGAAFPDLGEGQRVSFSLITEFRSFGLCLVLLPDPGMLAAQTIPDTAQSFAEPALSFDRFRGGPSFYGVPECPPVPALTTDQVTAAALKVLFEPPLLFVQLMPEFAHLARHVGGDLQLRFRDRGQGALIAQPFTGLFGSDPSLLRDGIDLAVDIDGDKPAFVAAGDAVAAFLKRMNKCGA